MFIFRLFRRLFGHCGLLALFLMLALCAQSARAAVVYDQIAVQDALGNVTILQVPRFVPDSVTYSLSVPAYGGSIEFNGVRFRAQIDPRFQHFDRFGNVRNNFFRR